MVRNRLALMVAVLGLAASASAQSGGVRVGIGAAVSNTPALLVPIDVTSRIRIEPEIGVIRDTASHDSDVTILETLSQLAPISATQETRVTTVSAGAGAFFVQTSDKIKMQYGVRAGYARSATTVSLSAFTFETRLNGYFIAPAVGGEYFVVDRFSLGAELQVRYTSLEGQQDSGVAAALRPLIVPNPTNRSQTILATRASVVARLYFK
jgi:hypothetical protein